LLICLLQPILYFTLETYGLRGTASSTAGLVLGALPAAVAALSVPMLKERLSGRQVIGLALSVSGVVAIVLEGGRSAGSAAGAENAGYGLALIVGALVSAAFYNIYSRKASAVFSPAETTFAMMASGAAFFGMMAVGEGAQVGWSATFARATPASWGAIAYLGLMSSVVAFFFVNLSLSRLRAAQASIFGTLTTLVSLVAGVAVRGEPFGPLQAFGAAGIVAGVWMTNSGGSSSRR
jgi:drug/metabolite transporter (DMT)-like permease